MTNEPKTKKHGDASTTRVAEALIKFAGELLLRSKLPTARKMELCATVGQMQKDFETLAAEAWGE